MAGLVAPTVTVHWHGRLNDFFRGRRRRGRGGPRRAVVSLGSRRSVKDILESLGVPHVEIGFVSIDGRRASLRRILKGGERIVVDPCAAEPRSLKFACDIHLARLARRLRMAGFDAVLEGDDVRLAELTRTENRILLTRDVGLLKRSAVCRGYWLRHQRLDDQWDELRVRFASMRRGRHRARCPGCNGLLRRMAFDRLDERQRSRIPCGVRRRQDVFWVCRRCGHVYWTGSHHRRLTDWFRRKGQRTAFASAEAAP